ncbi:MAG: hypothetical protein KF760_21880 [Candidatus Eremiobacteraeota bacterium]|nr:hypothetical protein [Candidatus Eremiobacteraeota bacterium]
MVTLAFLLCLALALVWLAVLKFFPRLPVMLMALLGLAYLGLFGWSLTLKEQMAGQSLAPAVGALVLWFVQKRGKLSPLLSGSRSLLGWLLPLMRGGLLLGLAVPGAVRPLGFEALLGMLCLALVSSEGARRSWRSLGLLRLPGGWAWLVWAAVSLGAWYARADLLPAVLLLVLLRSSATVAVDPELTPSRATVMLKVPMTTMNALLELVPVSVLRNWFRPDPFRLHLREPLLEAQNAPAYLAALAAHLSQLYAERLETDAQLADFCVRYPESAARGLLSMPAVEPVRPGPEFQSNDLGALRKPSKLTQLAHLVRLRKIQG